MEKINNFEEYGFTGAFKGEILKEVNGYYIGYVFNEDEYQPVQWRVSDGDCYDTKGYIYSEFSLTPIKKKWYEDEENIGKLIKNVNTNTYAIFTEYKRGSIYINNDIYPFNTKGFRPTTKEELLSLLIKE